jgi:hypothetical protein
MRRSAFRLSSPDHQVSETHLRPPVGSGTNRVVMSCVSPLTPCMVLTGTRAAWARGTAGRTRLGAMEVVRSVCGGPLTDGSSFSMVFHPSAAINSKIFVLIRFLHAHADSASSLVLPLRATGPRRGVVCDAWWRAPALRASCRLAIAT